MNRTYENKLYKMAEAIAKEWISKDHHGYDILRDQLLDALDTAYWDGWEKSRPSQKKVP